MATFRTTLAPETIAHFEGESHPDSWDWDEEIIQIIRTGERPLGATNYLGANGLMVAEYDAAVEPVWQMNGDDGITWEQFSAPSGS